MRRFTDTIVVLRPTRHSKRLRSVLTLLAVALSIAQFAGPLHEMLASHRVCAQHGELVKVSTHHDGPSPDVPVSDHRHEHCALLLANNRAAERPVVVAASSLQPPAVSVTFVAPPQPQFAVVPVLRYAPKNSPPAG